MKGEWIKPLSLFIFRMIDFTTANDFDFWLPMYLSKSAEGDKKGGKKRMIEGIASTPDVDLQKETVRQLGIDFSYFLKYGYYNNDHKPGFQNKVGQPVECRVTKEGLWTKGFLFRNHEIADAIWELANALEASQADRKLGFSIQGKVLRRAGRQIMKCWVQDIAITAAPINTNTWLDIVKSLEAVPDDMWVCDENGCYIPPRLVSPVHKSNCGTCPKGGAERLTKQFQAIDEKEMDLKKKTCGCDEREKALSAQGQGRILVPESLEGKRTDLEYGGASAPKKRMSKSLTFSQCVDLLQEHRGLSNLDAQVVAETVFSMNGISL